MRNRSVIALVVLTAVATYAATTYIDDGEIDLIAAVAPEPRPRLDIYVPPPPDELLKEYEAERAAQQAAAVAPEPRPRLDIYVPPPPDELLKEYEAERAAQQAAAGP